MLVEFWELKGIERVLVNVLHAASCWVEQRGLLLFLGCLCVVWFFFGWVM